MQIDNTLSQYFSDISDFPMLGAAEERKFATRWRKRRDRRAVEELVGSHLRLVAKIVRGFRGYGLPLDDLIAEGNVGLMQAAQRFEPERGFRFATYAVWWIRAAIQEFVMRNLSIVRMGTTAAQKKLFFNLRRLKAELSVLDDGELDGETTALIASELRVPEREVAAMNRRLKAGDRSLNATVGLDSDEQFQDLLVDQEPDQESRFCDGEELARRRNFMAGAISTLNARERHILSERRLQEDPPTLADLSEEYGISRERVRQIEVRAFEKLQIAMLEAAAATERRSEVNLETVS